MWGGRLLFSPWRSPAGAGQVQGERGCTPQPAGQRAQRAASARRSPLIIQPASPLATPLGRTPNVPFARSKPSRAQRTPTSPPTTSAAPRPRSTDTRHGLQGAGVNGHAPNSAAGPARAASHSRATPPLAATAVAVGQPLPLLRSLCAGGSSVCLHAVWPLVAVLVHHAGRRGRHAGALGGRLPGWAGRPARPAPSSFTLAPSPPPCAGQVWRLPGP